MYGLRRVCLLSCSWIMSASTIHLLNLPSDQAAANLSQGLSDLQAISINHHFAARCIDIIRSLANKWNIALPNEAALRGLTTQWSSPTSSAFFAASIPRKSSTQSNARSGSSVSSGAQNDTPFAPPQHSSSQGSHHATLQRYYSDPSTLAGASQSQYAFWTPFPVQGAPMQPPGFNDVMMDLSPPSIDGVQGVQWQMFGGATSAPDLQLQGHTPTSSTPMHAGMGAMDPGGGFAQGMSNWQWQ